MIPFFASDKKNGKAAQITYHFNTDNIPPQGETVINTVMNSSIFNLYEPFMNKKELLKKINKAYATHIIFDDEKALLTDWKNVGIYIEEGIQIVVAETPELQFSEVDKDQLNLGLANQNV